MEDDEKSEPIATICSYLPSFEYLSLRFRLTWSRFEDYFKLQQKWDIGKQFAYEHPFFTAIIMVALAFCSIPLACFITFAVGSMIITFFGFILLEGFLLVVGGALLLIVLGGFGFITVFGLFLLLCAFTALAGGQQMFQNIMLFIRKIFSRQSSSH